MISSADFAQVDSPDFALDTTGVVPGVGGVADADSGDFTLNTTGLSLGIGGATQSDSADFTLNTTGVLSGIGGAASADSADFTLDTQSPFLLILTTNGIGVIATSPNQTSYASNSAVVLTAIPSPGWAFLNWSGDASGTSNSLNVVMTTNKSITAKFTRIPPPGIIAQWNFNSFPPDTDDLSGTTTPAYGRGTASLVGGTSESFASGDTIADPAGTTDNSEWEITDFPGSTSSNKSAGVRFDVSTAAYKDISVSWRQAVGTSASKYGRLQYTTNGSSFVDFPTSVAASSGSFETQSNNLANIASVNGQVNFGFRIVTEFESTATGSDQAKYVPRSGGNYTPGARVGFDMVTVYGQTTGGAATLYPLIYMPAGYFQLAVTGSLGSSYVIQLSTNLATTNWLPVQTNSSPFSFTGSNTAAPQRFYRALFLQ